MARHPREAPTTTYKDFNYVDYQLNFIFAYGATYLFCALYCIVIFVRLGQQVGNELEVRYFRRMVTALFVYCIAETIWAVVNFSHDMSLSHLNVPLSIVNNLMISAICYYWFCFMESYLQSRVVDQRPMRLLAFVPFGIAIVITVATVWTGQVFYLDASNTAARGPLYLLVTLLSYLYASIASIRAIAAASKTTSRVKRRHLLTMATFAIPPAIVGVVDTFVPLMPIIAPAFFFSFLLIFTMLQDSQISHDSLTGLNNRRRADSYLAYSLAHATKANPMYYFVIDGDNFKSINDTYGHLEGDRALCAIANALKDACRDSNAFIARWGGDEFVIIAFKDEISSPQELSDRIDDCLLYERTDAKLPFTLNATVGWAECTDSTTPARSVMQQADEMLYRAKRARK